MDRGLKKKKKKLEENCCYGLHKKIQTRNAITIYNDNEKHRKQKIPMIKNGI